MIQVLEKAVADKIAAGEVIDRPVSIIKELVENALDAEAASITVELRKGGKEYLRITDDGCGIPAEEVELAFRRHATSKISSEKDLDAISSLGFRGEALASICAVARVDMITKTAGAHAGRHVVCEGSEILENSATGCPDGTTITVRDLFYNLPARKKFLGSDGAETRRIIDLMSRIALAYPDVKFRVMNGKQEVLRTAGKGNILDNIMRIYGRDIGRDLVKVDAASGGGMVLRGFVSSPGTSATARNRQFFCVNGRVVSSKTMERGLEKAYRERLFPGRFPIAFLFLTLPADQLDVNVHPTKKEVRFDDEFAVEDFVTDAVAAALQQNPAIPSADPADVHRDTATTDSSANAGIPGNSSVTGEQVDIKNLLKSMRQETQLNEASFEYNAREGVVGPFAQNSPEPSASKEPGDRPSEHPVSSNAPEDPLENSDSPESAAGSSRDPVASGIPEAATGLSGGLVASGTSGSATGLSGGPVASGTSKSAEAPTEHPASKSSAASLDIAGLQVIGTVFDTYIIAAEGDTMYIIDQHAAHERVFYEKLLRQYHASEKYSQEMLLPLQVTVSAEVEHAEESWIGFLREMGYDIEFFGSRTYIVRAMPAFAEGSEGERFLRELLLGLEEKPDVRSFASLERLIMRSCKSAVKGGDALHPEEVRALLRQLADCKNPWSCPHGRPTIVRMRKRELERMFKR